MKIRKHLAALAAGGLLALSMLAFAPRQASADTAFDVALFNLINQDRTQNGLAPLQWSPALSGVGEATQYGGCGYNVNGRAEDMMQRSYFAHPILNCGTQNVFNMENNEGIHWTAAGENIGWESGITDPTQAANYLNTMYMNSTEHRANILNPSYTEVGVGSWQTAPGATWSGGGGAYGNVVMSVEEFAAHSGTAGPLPGFARVKGEWYPITYGIANALRTGN